MTTKRRDLIAEVQRRSVGTQSQPQIVVHGVLQARVKAAAVQEQLSVDKHSGVRDEVAPRELAVGARPRAVRRAVRDDLANFLNRVKTFYKIVAQFLKHLAI